MQHNKNIIWSTMQGTNNISKHYQATEYEALIKIKLSWQTKILMYTNLRSNPRESTLTLKYENPALSPFTSFIKTLLSTPISRYLSSNFHSQKPATIMWSDRPRNILLWQMEKPCQINTKFEVSFCKFLPNLKLKVKIRSFNPLL